MLNPKVSIIMAVYNCEKTVGESIDSIINQTYKNWELIICDDGSTDHTSEILKRYQKRYSNSIKVLYNKNNSKLPYSLNHCLKYATGDYVARMDGDDISYPERLKKQVSYMLEHPDIDVVGTAMTCFNEKGITGIRYPVELPEPSVIGRTVPFFHATIMMKKKCYNMLGGYSLKPYVLRCEDVDLWFRFFSMGFTGANLQEPLYYVREDLSAARRRNIKNGFNAARTLFHGYMRFHYPVKQYIYIFKPIVSVIVPYNVKYLINSIRWRINRYAT